MPTRPSSGCVSNAGCLAQSLTSCAQASTGSVSYVPDKSAFVWKIKQLNGGREFLMRAHFGLPSVRGGMLLVTTSLTPFLTYYACFEQSTNRWTSVPLSRSSSRSRTSPCPASKSGTSRLWRRVGTRRSRGCGTSRKTVTTTGVFLILLLLRRICVDDDACSLRTALEKGSAPIIQA